MIDVFNFGIDSYRPQWLDGLSTIMAAHGERLGSLTGRRLTHTWLMWDLDGNSWWSDGPVLFDFAGEQVEINHQKFADVSITWNSVPPATPVRWGNSDETPLAFRDDASAELLALRDSTLRDVELLEYTGGDLADGAVAVSFIVTAGRVTIYNALDENALEFEEPAATWRRCRVS